MNRRFKRSTVTRERVKFTERELSPKVVNDKRGNLTLLCPFCVDPHPINANTEAPCGTLLRVMAVQNVYKSKFYPGMVCVKCGESGDEMVKFHDGYAHIKDCKPGTKTLSGPVPFSRMAKFVFHLKEGRIKKYMVRLFGTPHAVKNTTPDGTKTEIIGYVFVA